MPIRVFAQLIHKVINKFSTFFRLPLFFINFYYIFKPTHCHPDLEGLFSNL